MPEGAVHAVLQDSRGFMWFGTYDGLVRYDGADFLVCRHSGNDRASIGDNRIRGICEDAEGNIWYATEGAGLGCWQRKLDRFLTFRADPGNPLGLQTDYIRCLLPDGEERLWVGTYGDGLLRFDTRVLKFERFDLVPPAQGQAAPTRILSLCLDRSKHLWVGTEGNGLIEVDPSSKSCKSYTNNLSGPNSAVLVNIRALCEDEMGFIWVGTDRGLARIAPDRRGVEALGLGSPERSPGKGLIIDALLPEKEGRVWIGTDGAGLSLYDASGGPILQHRHVPYSRESLSSDVIRTVYQDRQGDLWVGTYPNSVHYASRLNAAFRTFRSLPTQTNSLSDSSVTAILEATGGNWFVGTDRGGLNLLDRKTGRWRSFRHDFSNPFTLSSDTVLCLHRDRLERLWVGTWNGGLNRFDPATGRFTRYLPDADKPYSINSPHIWSIAEDKLGQIWVATSSGVNRYDPNVDGFIAYHHNPRDPRSLNHDNARCLLLTRSGSLWVGTREGLARWVPTTGDWERFSGRIAQNPGLQGTSILDLGEDRQGMLWVATSGSGLFKLNPTTGATENYGTAQGLPSDTVQSVVEDSNGFIWTGTLKGLARFDPEKKQFRVYSEECGLPGDHYHSGAKALLSSGDLLFGGTEGLARITPVALMANTREPPVVITRFEVDGRVLHPGMPDGILQQDITETRQVAVPPGAAVVSFRFAALGYRSPDQNRFSYKLEPFDKEWRNGGTERRVTYTNLDPGRYRLLVRAANDEGFWNEKGTVLELTILPFWWQTAVSRTGFFIALIAVFVTAGWGVAMGKARERLREANRQRNLAVERQKTAETLREIELRYRQLFELASDGISIVQDGIVRTINARFANLCGYPPDEVSGRPLSDFVHPEDRSLVLQRHAERLGGGNGNDLPTAYRFRLARKDGVPVWVELNTTLIQWEGKPATLNILRDITDRRRAEDERLQLERQMQQGQKLESLGVLAGGIAHDFNNLLTVILGHADLALMGQDHSSHARENLQGIRAACLKASDLCRQMLAYSGKAKFSIEPINLTEVVGEMLNLLRSSISRKVTLDLHLKPDLPSIRGDITQIRQVVMNLVINGAEAIGDAVGALSISTGVEFCSGGDLARMALHDKPREGHYVCLEVRDTGCGMNEETLKRIFEPFFTTKFTGRGLGLSAVLGIVKGHEGALALESTPGKGTRFRVLFPVDHRSGQIGKAARRQGDEWKGLGTVLLVDDEESVRVVGQRMLESIGFQVLAANNGQQAVELYRAWGKTITLVLMDLTMPQMSGEEACRAVLLINPNAKVILASGYSESDLASRYPDLRVACFMEKPYTLDTLRRRVRTALAGQSPSQSSERQS
jgi:PAS domain S-box-containing protein